ncbi:threonine/serine ThrE exporter family protein [Smaragdicoccus niigatensis]|uniref:threonine/serine ThrE exporter family protein n=1 Tax=Smaragdicoccus niigatensis TaxID=359359 RepID=UPI000376EB34|nr:threonine/serine exporter family protein [Smaragdicoccus niigatensis]
MSEVAEPVEDQAVAMDFLARLGATMLAAGYPVNIVRLALQRTAHAYGFSCPMLVLPNFIQIGDVDRTRMVREEHPVRFDQTFPLGNLVRTAHRGGIGPAAGSAELDRILALPPPYPAWVGVIGYALQCTAYGLMLQPVPVSMIAAVGLGLLIGAVRRFVGPFLGLRYLLPALCAFVVTLTLFGLERLLNVGHFDLRGLIAPLVAFLPGVAITLGVIESATGEIVSGSARLVAGLMQLAQLALGIVIAIQLVGLSSAEITDQTGNFFGPWAPWLGVFVLAIGIKLEHGPPRQFLPWLVLILFVSYASQRVTALAVGGYVSGFGGGLALMLCALALSRRRNMPALQTILAPGFWLLVPSSVGLIGITEITGGASSQSVVAMLASMISIALGFQVALAIWNSIPKHNWIDDNEARA